MNYTYIACMLPDGTLYDAVYLSVNEALNDMHNLNIARFMLETGKFYETPFINEDLDQALFGLDLDAYDAACEERSWGEDCDNQREEP